MVTSYCLDMDSRHKLYEVQRALPEVHNHNEGNKVMKRIKHAGVGLFVFAFTASGAAMATCPNTMPLELLVDCFVYEGNGSSSSPTGYNAYMDRYQDWLRMQPTTVVFPPETAASPALEN
jgi:hypothetical protein